MRWLWSLLALLLGRGRRGPAAPAAVERPRLIPRQEPSRGGENAVLALLVLAALAAVAFIVVYALDRLPAQTQLLGLALGLAFAFLAAASVVTSRALVPVEQISEPYSEPEHRDEQEKVLQLVEESGDRITRRRLLKLAAGGAGATLGAALIVPAASLGPVANPGVLRRSPWRRGLRLMDSKGRPLRADLIEEDSFYTAFPEGRSHDELGSPLVVVRVEPAALDLPAGRDARVGPGRDRRLLQDLHPRRLRGRALPRPALRADLGAAGAHLPVPLLDVRPGDGRRRPLRPRRPPAPAAPTGARRRRHASRRRRLRSPVGPAGGESGGSESAAPAGREDVHVIRGALGSSTRGPVSRRSRRRRSGTSSPTTGRSCSARSRCTRSSSSSGRGSSWRSSSSRRYAKTVYHGTYAPLRGADDGRVQIGLSTCRSTSRPGSCFARRTTGPRTSSSSRSSSTSGVLLHGRVPQAARAHLLRRDHDARSLALLEGYLGYSLLDDLLSGMGLAIGYAVALSIPFVGGNLADARLGRAVPGLVRRSGRGCTSPTSSCSRSLSGR